ncbi:MAG TPA: hypothetical protein VIQ30_22800 [Pseudonocardia sp.]
MTTITIKVPVPSIMRRLVSASIVCAHSGDLAGVERCARTVAIEYGATGVDQAARFGALFGARRVHSAGGTVWTDEIAGRVDDMHPAMATAYRMIAATLADDLPAVDALVLAARAHRYQQRLLVSMAAAVAQVIHANPWPVTTS